MQPPRFRTRARSPRTHVPLLVGLLAVVALVSAGASQAVELEGQSARTSGTIKVKLEGHPKSKQSVERNLLFDRRGYTLVAGNGFLHEGRLRVRSGSETRFGLDPEADSLDRFKRDIIDALSVVLSGGPGLVGDLDVSIDSTKGVVKIANGFDDLKLAIRIRFFADGPGFEVPRRGVFKLRLRGRLAEDAVPQHALTVRASPADGGAVDVAPIRDRYPEGTQLLVTATPNDGHRFRGFTGDVTSEARRIGLGINRDTALVAEFVAVGQVSILRSGPGRVVGTGFDCGPTCSQVFDRGELVRLVAEPSNSRSVFVGWTGCDVDRSALCEVRVARRHVVTAEFRDLFR